jgi:hypothetical protein
MTHPARREKRGDCYYKYMKNMLAALALILAVNANAQQQSWQRLEGQHSGVKQTLAVAVQDSAKWHEIWREHDASAPVPEVDFTKQSVVVVFLGQTQTAGVKVTVVVQQDPLDSNRLNVFYRQTAVKKGFAAQVQCEPYAMVKVPRAATIDVEADGVMGVPERAAAPVLAKHDDTKVHALINSMETPSFDGN